MPGSLIAVVTDSTASLPAELAQGLTVVPLTVVVSGAERREGVDITPGDLARALAARRTEISTSRPAPGAFAEVYRSLLAAGAPAVLSVHLSARLSGTYDAAVLAAAEFAERVAIVDTHSTAMGLGFPAIAAARAAAEGQNLDAVRDVAVRAAERTTTLFYVDTLEFLRRGGRIGAASALVGTALSVKPLLHMTEGGIVVRDRVRTATRALARLADLAVEAAGKSTVDIAVHHLGTPQRAGELVDTLLERLADQARNAYVTEVGGVVGAHVGPGMVAVVVHRVDTSP